MVNGIGMLPQHPQAHTRAQGSQSSGKSSFYNKDEVVDINKKLLPQLDQKCNLVESDPSKLTGVKTEIGLRLGKYLATDSTKEPGIARAEGILKRSALKGLLKNNTAGLETLKKLSISAADMGTTFKISDDPPFEMTGQELTESIAFFNDGEEIVSAHNITAFGDEIMIDSRGENNKETLMDALTAIHSAEQETATPIGTAAAQLAQLGLETPATPKNSTKDSTTGSAKKKNKRGKPPPTAPKAKKKTKKPETKAATPMPVPPTKEEFLASLKNY